MMTPDAKRKLMWSLGFLKVDVRKKIFDRIVELESEWWRSNKTDFYDINSLFNWIKTSEGGPFWCKVYQQQEDFTFGKTFCPHPTIIEIDDI